MDGVPENTPHFRLVIDRISLVAGSEIEYLSASQGPQQTVVAILLASVILPFQKFDVRRRNIERIEISFGARNREVFLQSLHDGMLGVEDVDMLGLAAVGDFAPASRCALQRSILLLCNGQ